jgi:tape measure domain-containing protein
MASLGDLVVNLQANNSHFNKGLKESRKALQSFATATAVIGGVAGAALTKLAADAETLKLRFTSLLKSGTQAAAMLDEIGQFAANTPFGKVEIADATRTLLGFSFGAESALSTVKNLGEVSAQSGARMADLANILGKAVAKNKVEAETLNQLIERQVPILRALAEVTGHAESSLFDLASAGAITGDDLQAAFDLMGTSSDYAAGAMEALASTTAGQWSTMIDNATMLGEKIGAVLLPPVNAVLSSITNLLQQFASFATVIGVTGAALTTTAGVIWVVNKAIAAYRAALVIARAAQVAFLALTGPAGWAAIAAGVAVAAGAIYTLDAALGDASQSASELAENSPNGTATTSGSSSGGPAPTIVKGWRDVEVLMNSIRKPRPNDDINEFNTSMKELGDELQRADDRYNIFSTHSLNANMSLQTTLKNATNEMSGFNTALAEAEQELAKLQSNLSENQQGNADFLAMGVSQEDIDRLATVQKQIDEVTEARKREKQAAVDAAKEAERAAQTEKRNRDAFNRTLKDTRTQLRIQMGLMTEIDAQVQAQRDKGIGEPQLAQYRELLEAQAELQGTTAQIGQQKQGGALAQQGSEKAFKIIANAGKDQQLLKEAQIHTKKLTELATNTAPEKRDGTQLLLAVQGAV